MNIASLAIIEDDERTLTYLEAQIRKNLDVNLIKTFNNGEQALADLLANPVEMALFDVQLPGISGIECIQRLKITHPTMQIMVLTVFDNNETIFAALKAGASGYLLKSSSPEKIIEAIGELHAGGSPMNATIARRVVEFFQAPVKKNDMFTNEELTRREVELLELLSKGLRYKEIADQLFISFDTVRTHTRNIYQKLHVNSKIEAINKVFGR